MLSFALALMIAQQNPIPEANPSTCRAAADELERVIGNAQRLLDEDQKAAANGGSPQYSAATRATVAERMKGDRTRIATIRQRYPAAAKPADTEAVRKSGAGGMIDLTTKCSA